MKTGTTAGFCATLLLIAACGSDDGTGANTRPSTGIVNVPPTIPGGKPPTLTGMTPGAAGTSAGIAGAPVTPPPPPATGIAGGSAPIGGPAGAPARPPFTGAAGSPAVPPAGAAGAPPTAAAGTGAPSTPPNAMGDRATTEGTCGRWKADRADIKEGAWSGDVASCNAGDIAPEGRANALRLINLYRWLADLPAVTTDPAMNMQAQQCALLQRANSMLNHTPPSTWTCYNDVGAKASSQCNISTGPGVTSVDGYMVDPGNPMTIGHRRWILSNTFGPTGLGSTDRHSCMMTTGKMKVNKAWQAWPAPGVIPLQAMQGGFGQKVDSTGWTIQSDTINLASAMVTVTVDGAAQPVTITQLGAYYGSRYAIRFNPMGWSTTAGKKYKVDVAGTTMPISYEVQIVDCK